ncbi:hypothetical protein FACS189418_5020 [Clostridia bacterium]|nr:hypothetical protein FACS189418_5020 [Clostridia bacterium]
MKKIVVLFIGILILLVIGFKGKNYMDRKHEEKLYQDAFKQIQTDVTEYLVEHYEGIEKIEWEGVGVEWRNSPIFGASMFGNYVGSDVKVYSFSGKYFTMDFSLNEEMEYDWEFQEKYVYPEWNEESKNRIEKEGGIYAHLKNPESIDHTIAVGIYNATDPATRAYHEEPIEFEQIKKSDQGSPNAKIKYDLHIFQYPWS